MSPDSMAGQSLKRFFKSSSTGHGTSTSSVSTSSTSSDECSSCLLFTKKPKRQAKVSMFEKWKRELNMEHKTSLWLRCNKDTTDKTLVSTLWCEVCRRYEDRLKGMRNYSGAWISGSTNHKKQRHRSFKKISTYLFHGKIRSRQSQRSGKVSPDICPYCSCTLNLRCKRA